MSQALAPSLLRPASTTLRHPGQGAREDWTRLVDTEPYGPMTLDDASFLRLTGLVKLRYAARQLAITPTDLRGRIAAGRIRGRKVGSSWYVSEGEIERYVQRRTVRASS